MIYAKEGLNINFFTVDLSTYAQEMIFEPVGIKFKIKKTTHIMIGIYMSPKQHGSVEAFLTSPRGILEPYSSRKNTAILIVVNKNIDTQRKKPNNC